MDHEEEEDATSGNPGPNLNDLQSYLTTFNKDIEPEDDVLSAMNPIGVDDADEVQDLYDSSGGNTLQGDGVVSVQFSSGFYPEQGILGDALSDETNVQLSSLDTSAQDREMEDELTSTVVKNEVGAIDMGEVDTQGLIMTSLGEGLDSNTGKVIRIVSLGENGHFLAVGDGSDMQILSEDLHMLGGATSETQAASTMASSSKARSILASPANSHLGLSSVSSSLGVSTNSILTCAGDNSSASMIANSGVSLDEISSLSQLVAMQGNTETDGTLQPQLVSLPQGSADSLQYSLLGTGTGGNIGDIGYQTVTILPQELTAINAMNYILLMASQDTEAKTAVPQIVSLKQEPQGMTEEVIEVNGEMKRFLRVLPKKYRTSTSTSSTVGSGNVVNVDGQQLLVCDFCDYTSPKRYLLTRHMKSHSDERPHKCTECHRGFKTPASLINHVNTHTGVRPHKCKTCEAAFTTSGELVRHIRYRHTFEKPHRCPNCDYASVELSKLKRHMRSHTGERPYKCPHCRYASPDTYKLKRHLRIHTGEKPYECDICQARFTQSNSLKAHKLIHSGTKPVFQCSLCPTTCGRKTDLKIHYNKLHAIGSPLECKKCGQTLADRYSFKQHMRSHDMDRCWRCEECGFIANTERSLDQHAMIHNNGKKYECSTCKLTFNLKQLLDKHSLTCTSQPFVSLSPEKTILPSGSVDLSLLKTEPGCAVSLSDVPNKSKEELDQGSSSHKSPTATSDTLHKNLLQDIKAGKLGDVPQVVIVHPDGTLQEIPSAHQGDKLNLDDVFSALSSTEKQEVVRQMSNRETSHALDSDSDANNTKNSNNVDLAEEGAETSQCEASTQAALESDSEDNSLDQSVDGDDSTHSNTEGGTQKEEQSTLTNIVEDKTEKSKDYVAKEQTKDFSVEKSSNQTPKGLLQQIMGENLTPVHSVASTLSSTSPVSTSTTPPLSSSLLTLSSLQTLLSSASSSVVKTDKHIPPTPQNVDSARTMKDEQNKDSHTSGNGSTDITSTTVTEVSNSNATDSNNMSNSSAYVIVKGYTCLDEDGEEGRPAVVNIALDRDSVMKFFASLGPAGDGLGLNLLSGEHDSSVPLLSAGSISEIEAGPNHLNNSNSQRRTNNSQDSFEKITNKTSDSILATTFSISDGPGPSKEVMSSSSSSVSSISLENSASTIHNTSSFSIPTPLDIGRRKGETATPPSHISNKGSNLLKAVLDINNDKAPNAKNVSDTAKIVRKDESLSCVVEKSISPLKKCVSQSRLCNEGDEDDDADVSQAVYPTSHPLGPLFTDSLVGCSDEQMFPDQALSSLSYRVEEDKETKEKQFENKISSSSYTKDKDDKGKDIKTPETKRSLKIDKEQRVSETNNKICLVTSSDEDLQGSGENPDKDGKDSSNRSTALLAALLAEDKQSRTNKRKASELRRTQDLVVTGKRLRKSVVKVSM